MIWKMPNDKTIQDMEAELRKFYNESDEYHEIGFDGMVKKFAGDEFEALIKRKYFYFKKNIKLHYMSKAVLKHYNY